MAAYATPSDITTHGVSEAALADVDLGAQQTALEAASLEADSYLRGRVTLPLAVPTAGASYPLDLVKAVCQIAAYDLLSVRGMVAESDLGRRADAARKWLKGISDGDIIPAWGGTTKDGEAGSTVPFVVQASVDTDGIVSIVTPSQRRW